MVCLTGVFLENVERVHLYSRTGFRGDIDSYGGFVFPKMCPNFAILFQKSLSWSLKLLHFW